MSDLPPEKVTLTPGEFAALFGKSQTWGYRLRENFDSRFRSRTSNQRSRPVQRCRLVIRFMAFFIEVDCLSARNWISICQRCS